MKVGVPYLVVRLGAGGRKLYYWQPSTALRKQGWRPRRLPDDLREAQRAAEEINTELARWKFGELPIDQPLRGTVAEVVAAWQASRFWHRLAPSTQQSYRQHLAVIMRVFHDQPLRGIRRRHLEALYQKLKDKTPAKANAVMRTCQALFRFAVRDERLREEDNPCRRMGLENTAAKGRVWSEAAVVAMVAAADACGWHSIGTAIALNAWCGQREGDVLTWRRPEIGDGVIRLTQSKTGARVALPIGIVPQLVTRLDQELARSAARTVQSPLLIVADDTGRPYKPNHFQHRFAEVRARAAAMARAAGDVAAAEEIDGLLFMHLRHTAIVRLAEAGCELAEIAAITGHTLLSCTQIIDRYLVRTERLAARAFRKRLEQEAAGRD